MVFRNVRFEATTASRQRVRESPKTIQIALCARQSRPTNDDERRTKRRDRRVYRRRLARKLRLKAESLEQCDDVIDRQRLQRERQHAR